METWRGNEIQCEKAVEFKAEGEVAEKMAHKTQAEKGPGEREGAGKIEVEAKMAPKIEKQKSTASNKGADKEEGEQKMAPRIQGGKVNQDPTSPQGVGKSCEAAESLHKSKKKDGEQDSAPRSSKEKIEQN